MAGPFQAIADALSGTKGAVTKDSGSENKLGPTDDMVQLRAQKLRMMNAQGLNFDGSPLKLNENTHIGNRGPTNTHGDIDKNLAEQTRASALRSSK